MRYLLALFMFPAAVVAQVSPVRGALHCPGVTNSLKCARSVEGRLNAPFVMRLGASALSIALAAGGSKDFRDVEAGDTRGVRYSAIAVSPDARYVILHRQFWEGQASGILDRRTGVETRLDGFPAISPDGRWVATVNADLAAGYSPNVLRIYRITPDGISLEYDAKPDKWGALDAAWTSANTLEYMHATYDCYEAQHGKTYTCRREKLQHDGTRWR